MVDLLRSALAYAALGWAVFPLKPGEKTPLTKHGLHDASTDESVIRTWWQQHPNANIGIATGLVSGFVVVDVDGPQGEDALARLGEMPPTPSSSTGKGRHLLFLRPAEGMRNTAGKLGPQLDTRADGGYIVAPPSLHPSGARYAWSPDAHPLRTPLAALPAVIAARLVAVAAPRLALVGDDEPRGSAAEIPMLPQVPDGQRNQTLAEYAGRLLAKGLSELEALELVRALNHAKCAPPLGADEVERIVMSIAASERRQKAVKAQAIVNPQPTSPLVPIDAHLFAALGEKNVQPIDAIPTMLPAWNDACRGFGGGQGLPRGWHITIGGASGTGKSLCALNLAAEALRNGTRIAYISLEMSIDQLLARLLAIVARRSIRELEPGPLYRPETFEGAVADYMALAECGSSLFIAERPDTSLGAIQHQMLAACDAGCRLIVVDYLQLISVPDADGIAEQTRRASQALQRIAFQHQVTTVALSQFNRATSFNAKESPTVHGLTGSSAIENDSDQVLLLDHSQKDRTGTTCDTRLLLAKNRHGPSVTIPVRWDFRTLSLATRAPTMDESREMHGIRTSSKREA